MTSSMKYGAPVEIREEEILFPLEEAQEMLNEPLQTFLKRFTDYSTPDINRLHLRTITSVFSKLGYSLEENLPPIERPGLSDISLFAYLQITEPLQSNNIIVLNLEEFNDLLSKVVHQQLGAFKRFFSTIANLFEGATERCAHGGARSNWTPVSKGANLSVSNFIVALSFDEYAWSKSTHVGVSSSISCDEICGANRACLAASCNLGDVPERRIPAETNVYRDRFIIGARSRI